MSIFILSSYYNYCSTDFLLSESYIYLLNLALFNLLFEVERSFKLFLAEPILAVYGELYPFINKLSNNIMYFNEHEPISWNEKIKMEQIKIRYLTSTLSILVIYDSFNIILLLLFECFF